MEEEVVGVASLLSGLSAETVYTMLNSLFGLLRKKINLLTLFPRYSQYYAKAVQCTLA